MSWKKKITTCATLASFGALSIHAINKSIYYMATLDRNLDKQNGFTFEWRFGNVFYTKQGSGSPILLIHELNPLCSGHEWNKVVHALSKTNTVYVLDLLGCGRSDKPNITYTNFLYVQLLTDFIKQVIGEKTDVISTGLSSSFVVMACKYDETIIRRVVMVNPHSFSSLNEVPTQNHKIVKFLINTPLIGTLIYNIVFSKKHTREWLERDVFYNSAYVSKELLETCFECAHNTQSSSKYLFASLKGNYLNVNITNCLQECTQSIFIISGEERIDELRTIANQYRKIAPAIETAYISKTIMAPHLERSEDFLAQIRLFLELEPLSL